MNWKKLLNELFRAGYSQKAVGQESRLTQSTISKLARGDVKDISYTSGAALVQLHERAVGGRR
ncbi:hypothetical protein [Variovorax sp. 278MFTsu5.1]|jgi:transcriptional regulator with XRE-family HTH domain|uniref:hypothetical protein n=1 Tax=Variovorax sp. 278MFTsu5.1 TaxID=3158366 RepID=UPI003AAAAC7D